jgi:ABC-type nitrate/sulfonate/bicarbonate transport system permease component
LKRALPAALLALLVLAAWELLVRLFGVPAFLLPRPSDIGGAFWESRDLLLRTRRFWGSSWRWPQALSQGSS